jgi:hypothetical protein
MERDSVPFIVHEGIVSRQERTIKRLVIALIIAISLMFVTNCIWIYYETQFETVTYNQDGEGINNVNTGTQGDVDNEPNS